MKFKMALSVALVAMLSGLSAAVVGDINVCTNVCAGSNISCKNQYLNCGSSHQDEGGGFGDLLNSAVDASERFYDWGTLKNIRTENLGPVKSEMMNFTTKFPANGQKKIIKVIATTGVLSGKTLELLFVSFDVSKVRAGYPKDTPSKIKEAMDEFRSENAKNEIRYASSVHIFGRIENGTKDWYNAGSINLSIKPDMANFDINMQVMADGTIIINDSELLDQTGADGAKARIAPIELNFSKVPEMLGQ